MTAPRPTCGHCGKPYGSRARTMETVRWPAGQERPPYRGNGIVLKEGFAFNDPTRSTMMAAAKGTANPTFRAEAEARAATFSNEKTCHAHRWIWDGETWWGGYPPFCTLRCALAYARKAYKELGRYVGAKASRK